ncbi:ubiquitin-like domain-containing protein [Isoptericola jiangsuensis]|uniref:aggregation-promoting factor C-terminal-like domain-containing protein n=1 Tax=Isoptericola jiangsuensis TaxID=548579 RepID=UPI003AAAE59F
MTPEPENFGSTTAETRAVTRTRRTRRRRVIIASATAGTLALGVGSAVGVSNAHKTVTLDVDGESRTVSTFSGDVAGLLAEEGVDVTDRDAVTPGPDAELYSDSDVVVRTGREVDVEVDGEEHTVWVTAADAAEALNLLNQRGDDVHLVASRSAERAALPVDLPSDQPVAVVHDGATDVVDGPEDLAAALDTVDVTLDDDDLVSVTAADDAGVSAEDLADADLPAGADLPQVAVVVERVEVETVEKVKKIAHETTTKKSDERYEDLDPKVRTEGADGERTVVREVTTIDGKEVSNKKISSEVTSEPVTEVLVQGTKERPEPEPAEESGSSGSSGETYSGSNRDIGRQMASARGWTGSQWTCLESLWTRESGWSHTAANPSSGAYGIPQSLPGSKMASAGSDWQTNPATQITWGLDYIAGRYGTPCSAWGHSESVGWY